MDYTTLPNGLKVPAATPVGSAGGVLKDDLVMLDAAIGNARGYVHEQTLPAAVWLVEHGLGRPVSVVTCDESGEVVYCDLAIVDLSTLRITSAIPFAGRAYVS